MTTINSNSAISSLNKKRRPTHEPPPVTFSDNRTPSSRLNRAIQSSNLQLVKRLLETHSNNKILDAKNQDPVTRKTSLILATETKNYEIFKFLIQNYHVDSDSISRDLENNTVLHFAAAEGLDDIIMLYHSHYPFVLDWANSEGMTALHIASQKGNESTVTLLLDFQADVELTDNEGNTSLHYAAAWGHLKIVLLLIDRGSPFWAKNNQTFTASDYAFSFSIQSALQDSARTHFESKKQQRHQRQLQDRDKERKQQRNVPGSLSLVNNSDSSINLSSRSIPTNRGINKTSTQQQDQQSSSLRSNNILSQSITNPIIPKNSNNNNNNNNNNTLNSSTNSHSQQLAPILTTHSISKPLTSPTNLMNTARSVSHLISKDFEAIQGFRTKATTGQTNPNHLVNSNNNIQPSLATNLSTLSLNDSPKSNQFNSSKLLPLQLVNAASSKSTTTAVHELRSYNSTGNLNKNKNFITSHPALEVNNQNSSSSSTTSNSNSSSISTHSNRNRAGSTDSENLTQVNSNNSSIGFGYREGLSRLKHLKNGVGISNHHHHQNLNPLNRFTSSNHSNNTPAS